MDSRVTAALGAWECTIGREETADPIWQLHSYRVARCLLDQVLQDVETLRPRMEPGALSQLSRAVTSIGANLSEGYSRRSPADRSRFYGYAMGSAREAAFWYRSTAPFLDASTLELRMAFLAQERMLLMGMIKSIQRAGGPKFEPA